MVNREASQLPPRASERARLTTLVALTGVGGYVDAVSYLGLGRVFTAAMTGNTVLLSLAVVGGDWLAALRSVVALIGFVAGIGLGQIVIGRCSARKSWPRAVGSGLMLELVWLGVLAAGLYLAGPPSGGWTMHLLIAASALAMGTQSATAGRLGVSAVSTTYVTGTLASLTSGTVDWLRSPKKLPGQARGQGVANPDSAVVHGPGLPAVAWCAYAAGAMIGGFAVMVIPAVAAVPAVLVVAILAVVDERAG